MQNKIVLSLKNREVYLEELQEILKINEDILLNELVELELLGALKIKGGKVVASSFHSQSPPAGCE